MPRGYSVHNTKARKIVFKESRTGNELTIFPGINRVSDKDFLIFGNQIQRSPDLKTVTRLADMSVLDEPDQDVPADAKAQDDAPVKKVDSAAAMAAKKDVDAPVKKIDVSAGPKPASDNSVPTPTIKLDKTSDKPASS